MLSGDKEDRKRIQPKIIVFRTCAGVKHWHLDRRAPDVQRKLTMPVNIRCTQAFHMFKVRRNAEVYA